jgi:hypothetical protein
MEGTGCNGTSSATACTRALAGLAELTVRIGFSDVTA